MILTPPPEIIVLRAPTVCDTNRTNNPFRFIIYRFVNCIVIGKVGLERVPHIRHIARLVRAVRAEESAGDEKQNAGGDSNGIQTGIVQITYQFRNRATTPPKTIPHPETIFITTCEVTM